MTGYTRRHLKDTTRKRKCSFINLTHACEFYSPAFLTYWKSKEKQQQQQQQKRQEVKHKIHMNENKSSCWCFMNIYYSFWEIFIYKK
jgi:hypothetical protein